MTVRLALALLAPVFLASLALSPAARAAPRTYTLEPAHSRLTIHVGKAGLFGFAGHEHEVVGGSFRGKATFDPDRLAQSSVDLTFDTGALRVTGQGEPREDVPQVQAAMVGATCLDAGRFPTVRFVSKSAAAAGAAGPNGATSPCAASSRSMASPVPSPFTFTSTSPARRWRRPGRRRCSRPPSGSHRSPRRAS